MRRAIPVAVSLVLAASGVYALIYLFRWEWHRAIITALFFVAAEIGLGVGVLLRRLARLEQRIDELASRPQPSAPDPDPAVLARIREAAPPTRAPFAWLDPKTPNLGVFLPFLLGVGALASGLAWVVEQMGRHMTAPVLERRLARRLAPLALPAGGLLGTDAVPTPTLARPVAAPRWALPMAVTTLMLGVASGGIDWLGDSLQTRPDHQREHVSTQIDLELRGARSAARPEQAAMILWGTCSQVLHGTVGAAAIHDVGGGRIQLVVPTHIGENAEQRLRGCLQDTVVDRVQATVLTLETIPED